MKTDKFRIPEQGLNIVLFTKSKTPISFGYNRIVMGGRGPYVEFTEDQIILNAFFIPKNCLYRLTDLRVYYTEFRSRDDSDVMLYYQLKTVAYADYKIGMFYISPKDLYLDTTLPIVRPVYNDENTNDFF